MNINKYIERVEFSKFGEVQKILFLGFYLKEFENKTEFTLVEITDKLVNLGFSKPNVSRLRKKIASSKKIVRGSGKGSYKLHFNSYTQIKKELNFLDIGSEEIITSNEILPESLYKGTRGYIEKLSLQINASYDNNIPDGCAILMRRLLEVLLILGYQNIGKESDIKDNNDDLKNLSSIINSTVSNKVFSLSKDSYNCIDSFRKLGNFSAHRIQYNCKKIEIDKVKMEYRVLIEELLYKSGLKN